MRLTDSLTPRRLELADPQGGRRHEFADRLTPRRLDIADRTEFITNPVGRVFNSRFSDRFKKS